MDQTHALEREAALESENAERRFIRSSALVGGLTFVSRLIGFVREVLVAGAFGTTSAASALVLAQTVPNLSRSLASEEVAQGTLVPALAKMSPSERYGYGWRLMWLTGLIATGVLAAVATTVFVLADQLTSAIGPGLTGGELDQTTQLLKLLVPVIVFNGVLGASSAFLVADGRFGAVGAGAIFSNVPILVGLVALRAPSVEDVALLLVAGYGLQALFLLAYAAHARSRKRSEDSRPVEHSVRVAGDLKRILLLAPPIVISLSMANLSGVVDMAFSSLVSVGAPAALDKAFRLVLLPYGVFAVAIGVVALPSLARAALDHGDFDGELVRAVRLQAVILLPLAVATALLADDIVGIAYERGAFNEASSALTSDALVGVAVALPAMGLSLVGTRAWISRQRPWTPALVATLGLVLNAGLDAALIGPLGVMGIGIATAVVHAGAGLVLILTASANRRAIGVQLMHVFTRLGGLILAASAVAVLSMSALAWLPTYAAHAIALALGVLVLLVAAPHFGVRDYQLLFKAFVHRPRTASNERR